MSQRFVLIGHPVGHSVSPAIHQAAYRELGLTGCAYELLDVETEHELESAVSELRRGAIAGANVTIPWKRSALRLADRADPVAVLAGAANTLVRESTGAVVAHNTDVPALASELERLGARPGVALVLGNGGAARAAVLACRRSGATEIGVAARRWASEPGVRQPSEFEALGATALPWPGAGGAAFLAWATRAEVILQATSVGMLGALSGDGLRNALPWEALTRGTLIYDLVYNPRVTPIVEEARARGFRAEGGLGMLVAQARFALELWFGREVEPSPLLAAAVQALASTVK